VGHAAKSDTGQAELTEVPAGTTRDVAPIAVPRRARVARHLGDLGIRLTLVSVGGLRVLDDLDELCTSLRIAFDDHSALVVLGDL